MNDYTFYFDESAKIDKITVDTNGKINLTKNQIADSFIGIFSGFKTYEIEHSNTLFLNFEKRQKSKFKIGPDYEIKSTFIKKKYFKYGLSSLKPEHLEFYSDLFDTMSDMHPILSVVCMSKMEMFVRNTFKNLPDEDAYYVLTKFLITYGDEETFSTMTNVCSKKDEDMVKRIVSKKMKQVINRSKNIPRMATILNAYPATISMIMNKDVNIRTSNKTDINYESVLGGLTPLLNSNGINVSDVTLNVDGEPDLYPNIDKIYPNVHFVNSTNEPLIRFSDHIAGFLNRIILSINKDMKSNEPTLDDLNRNDVDFESKRLLKTEWFKINKNTFEVYRKIYRILMKSQPYYWSTVTSSFSDELILFYSLLEYFEGYSNYEDYCNIALDEHSNRYNSLACCKIIDLRFNR